MVGPQQSLAGPVSPLARATGTPRKDFVTKNIVLISYLKCVWTTLLFRQLLRILTLTQVSELMSCVPLSLTIGSVVTV